MNTRGEQEWESGWLVHSERGGRGVSSKTRPFVLYRCTLARYFCVDMGCIRHEGRALRIGKAREEAAKVTLPELQWVVDDG